MKSQSRNTIVDRDFVPPDPSRPVKPGTPLPQETLQMEGFTTEFRPLNLQASSGKPVYPDNKKWASEIDIFHAFVDPYVVDTLVEATNLNAERSQSRTKQELQNKERDAEFNNTSQASFTPNLRPWKPVSKPEMYRFLGITIYQGLFPEIHRSGYWRAK